MMAMTIFLLLLPAFCLVGRTFSRQAAGFIHEREGESPQRLPEAWIVVFIFALTASGIATQGLAHQVTGVLIFRDLVLLSWCLLLTLLDLARQWLPQQYTNGLILSALLFSLLPGVPVSLAAAAGNGIVMFSLLWLFRCWANRYGEERFGLGDVWLLAGLSAWLTLPVTAGLTLCALVLIALRQLAGLAGITTRAREIPFAPWLSLCLCAALLTQTFPFTTG